MENREYEIDSSQINFNIKGSLFESTQNYRPNIENRVPIMRLDDINENQEEFMNEETNKKEKIPSYSLEEENVNIKENTSSNKASINKQSSLSDLMSQKPNLD